MTEPNQYFSPDFVTAQRRFREAIAGRHGRLDTLKLESTGPSGEELAIDIGWFGAATPKRVFVHTSGLHGVEGYAGSAIQLQWLAEGLPTLPDDAAIAVVHILNPYGYAWLRRFNEHNVDLNRNFRAPGDDGSDIGTDDYLRWDSFLNPQSAPWADFFHARLAWSALRYGSSNLRQALAGGQCIKPRGLFYGGARLEQGPALYQNYMQGKLERADRIVAIDVHTGLGPYGEDTLLVEASKEREDANRTMRRVFGDRIQDLNKQGIAYAVRGAHPDMYYRLFPQAATYFVGQEFGTYREIRVLAALRAENRWHHYGSGSVSHPCKKHLLEMFCPYDIRWREKVLQRGQTVVRDAHTFAFGQG